MTIVAAAGVLLGLIIIRSGRGPLKLAIFGLLHVQAALLCSRAALAAAAYTFSRRYKECLEEAWRNIMLDIRREDDRLR
jgi:hypothetical protein